MNFKGKTVISTGSASGMGLLFAQNVAQLGANVVMCDVNEEVLNQKVCEINKKGMDYPTSKAGLMYGLTKSIAQYGSYYNIRCV